MSDNGLKGMTKKAPKGKERWFDITGQVYPALIKVKDKDAGNVEIPSRMVGANFVGFAVYGQRTDDKSDKIWVSDRILQNVLVAGKSLRWDNKKKRFEPKMLILRQPKEFIIEATDDTQYDNKIIEIDTFRQCIIDNYSNYKTQFPDMTTAPPPDAPEFGNMTADEYRKVNDFFDDGEVYGWQWADDKKTKPSDPGKWVVVKQGSKKMEAYSKIIDNMRLYYLHMMYMDYMDNCATKKIIDIAKDEDKNLVKGDMIDPRPNTKAGITDDKIRRVMKTWLQDVELRSPVNGLVVEDVRIWLYYKFYLQKGVFKALSANKKFAQDSHSVKAMTKDKDHEFFYNIKAWEGFITFLVGALANSQYSLEETELFKLCSQWDDQATRLRLMFL